MKLRTYQAYTMAEALSAVKEHLGHDAVILHTRTFKRGGILGVGQRTLVEVTATPAPEREAAASPPPARSPNPRAAAARRGYAAVTGARTAPPPMPAPPVMVAPPPPRVAPPPVVPPPVIVPRSIAPAAPAPRIEPSPVAVSIPPRAAPVEPAAAPRHQAARRFILQPAEAATAEPVPAAAAAAPPAPARRDQVEDELSAIRHMVGQVLHRQGGAGAPSPDMPQKLFDLYLKLIGQELSEELADSIVKGVREDLDDDDFDDDDTVREAVLRRLAECIPVADQPVPIASPDGRPLTIALVGPTGVGKTTTLAKLAASFKLRHGRRVGLVTADTYRIAAVDQLRTYANIIGLPLEVALTPADMRRAVHRLADCDVILVDTAGRSQNDEGRIAELESILGAADPHEVHLVLSSTAGEKVLLQEAEAFGVVGVDKIVLTKIDEAVSFGILVNVVRQVGKELSFLTTGQEVPDHIERGRSERLADLVLGGSVQA